MAYIGNNPELVVFNIGVEKFNGNSSCTQFQLSRTGYSDNNAIEVVVGGAQIRPTNDYGVNDGLLTFTPSYGPPTTGTQNIVVTYRAPVVITFDKVNADQLVPGAITETAIGAGIITNTKYAADSITGDKLKNEGIIRANNIVDGTITGNLIGIGAVSGNNIGIAAISGNQIGLSAISGNQIGLGAISGNQIGIGAVSANNFAGGGITSNVLSSNLAISITRVLETANVFTIAPTGNLQIDISNNTLYYFSSNTTGNVTFNLRGNSVNTFDSTVNVGQTVSLAIALRHGTAAGVTGGRHTANVYIDGGLISTNKTNPDSANVLFYAGNTVPQYVSGGVIAGQNGQGIEFNLYALTVFKRASNTYTVLQANTIYGLGY
jgi:hypothetical protein